MAEIGTTIRVVISYGYQLPQEQKQARPGLSISPTQADGFFVIDTFWESEISGGAENFSLMANVRSKKDRAYRPGP
jgi:hypothetical protein